MDAFLKSVLEGILLGGVYALIVLGVVVVAKATKIVNLAYGGILLVLTYFVWWLIAEIGMPWPAALALMIVLAAVIGLLIDRFLMRPLIGRPEAEMVTFIGTVILGGMVLTGITFLVWGGVAHPMPHIIPSGVVHIGSVTASYTWLVAFGVGVLMFIAFVVYFRYSKNGLAMRCVAAETRTSQSLGINVKRIFSLSWIVGSISAGVGGFLLASMFVLDGETGNLAMTRALPVLLLAGIVSLPGAFVGAMIIGLAEVLAGAYVDPHISGFRQVLPFILMLVILLILPNGLFGRKAVRRL